MHVNVLGHLHSHESPRSAGILPKDDIAVKISIRVPFEKQQSLNVFSVISI